MQSLWVPYGFALALMALGAAIALASWRSEGIGMTVLGLGFFGTPFIVGAHQRAFRPGSRWVRAALVSLLLPVAIFVAFYTYLLMNI